MEDLPSLGINLSIRYREGVDAKVNAYHVYVLDDVMENINLWTKRLLLGLDQDSWLIHSPNVMDVQQSNHFENREFVKARLALDSDAEPNFMSESIKTTEPR